ncbi:cytochrome P450 [Micromonospora sp. KC207]|uniref:Cytochrome P450 n=1 Tax=Micromonospora carbonacea TaxID=47853 RepID=A0A7D6C7X1_9ACTN|nr:MULTISPECIES: cytochrome P450 [unclassified Micromonospora]EEP74804.1 cytochrome P450 [Micromonospora sp. ATCC 39149]QLK00585.1 cytochrome P450 [Micromonospora carbonacea]TDC65387.1 cytochrome P450 [Micromonospora sp. KC207]
MVSGGPIRDYPFEMHEIDSSPLYATLRRDEPMSRVQLPYGEPAWLATRYADVKVVLTDPRFSRAIAQGLDQPRLRRQLDGDGIMGMDPPDHTRLRRLVGKAFTARRVEAMRADVRNRARRLVDAMVAKGPPADLVEEFARPLPVSVICDLLGVPFADHQIFREWTEGLTDDATAKREVFFELGDALGDYMAGLVAQRRREPTDDLLGALVRARDNGDKLSEDELISIAGPGLLTGGVETVSSGLPSFVFTLLTHPEQLALLGGSPELMPTAVEELLRFVPINTAAMFARYALADVAFGDVVVRAGDPVLPALAAGNRDPEVFADPERIDLTRRNNPHLAFGHGPHHCIGAQLARLELQEALTELLTRLPGLRLAEGRAGVRWKYGVIVRGPARLPVTW